MVDCKTVGFFLKISKEIGKAWRSRVLEYAKIRIVLQFYRKGNLSLFELQGLEYYFPKNFRRNLTYYENETFCDS